MPPNPTLGIAFAFYPENLLGIVHELNTVENLSASVITKYGAFNNSIIIDQHKFNDEQTKHLFLVPRMGFVKESEGDKSLELTSISL